MQAGMSQAELARKAGISVRTIQGYEQGRDNIEGIALTAAIRLAGALGCRVSDLIYEPILLHGDIQDVLYEDATTTAEVRGTSNCPLCARGGCKRIWDYDDMVVTIREYGEDPNDPYSGAKFNIMCREHYFLAHPKK